MTSLFKIWIGIMVLGSLLIAINVYELFFDERDQLIEDLIPAHKIENQTKVKKLLKTKNCYHDSLLKEKCHHHDCEQLRYNMIKRTHYTSNQTLIKP